MNNIDFKELCRGCLKKLNTNKRRLSEFCNEGIKYSEMLIFLYGSKESCDTSNYMCNTCTSVLSKSYFFKKRYIETEHRFLNFLKSECKNNCEDELQKNVCDRKELEAQQIEKIMKSSKEEYEHVQKISSKMENQPVSTEDLEKNLSENNDLTFGIDDETLKKKNSFDCLKCDRPNSSKQLLEKIDIDNAIIHNCNRCKLKFDSKNEYSIHCRKAHNTEDDLYNCPRCKHKFKMKKDFKKHCIDFHKNEDDICPLKCIICNVKFTSKQEYRSHKNACLHACNQCKIKFNSIKEYRIHWKTIHEEKKIHLCTQCGKSFTYYTGLKQHERIHRDDRRYKCNECGKEFVHSTSYRRHLIAHTDERHFKCTFCDRTFRFVQSLNEHLNVHTGERPFKCKICPKQFKKRQTLKCHMVTHTKERKEICSICQKSYGTKSTLYRHMKIHLQSENLIKET